MLIARSLDFWDDNPVFITVDSTHAQVSGIDFPTVTVCPEEFSPPDVWAAAELNFNSVDFACDGLGQEVDENGCGAKARQVRADMKRLFGILSREKTTTFRENSKLNIFTDYVDDEVQKRMEEYIKVIASMANNATSLYTLQYEIMAKIDDKILTQESADTYLNRTLTEMNKYSTVKRDNVTKDAFDFAKAMVSSVFALLGEGWMDDPVPYGTFMKHFYRKSRKACSGMAEFASEITTQLKLFNESSSIGPPPFSNIPVYFGTIETFETFRHLADYCTHLNVDYHCFKLWTGFSESRTEPFPSHPCKKMPVCCNPYAKNRGSMNAMLTAMLRTQMRAKLLSSREGLAKQIQTMQNIKKYHIVQEPDLQSKSYERPSSIPICSFQYAIQTNEASCNLFDPVLTDVGICYAFNANSPVNLLQESPYSRDLGLALHQVSGDEVTIQKGAGSGKFLGLDFYLDTHWHAQKLHSPNLPQKTFLVAIGNSNNTFDVRNSGSVMRLGYHIQIQVTPHVVEATNGLRELAVEKRRCRFRDEVDGVMTIFSQYTQSGCHFECMLNQSRNICGCTPWNYPHPANDSLGLCDVYGNYCFEFIMRKKHKLKKCPIGCLPDCEDLYFTFKEKEAPIDEDWLCGPHIETFNYTLQDDDRIKYPFLWRYYHKGSMNKTAHMAQYCHDRAKFDMAQVSVYYAMPRYVRHKQSKRVTMSDRIANLGKGVM